MKPFLWKWYCLTRVFLIFDVHLEEEFMDNKGPFGIYDESFDLDRDGELNATEFDHMMEEYEKAGLSSDS